MFFLIDKKDIFFIRVQAFSQDEILTQSLLKETPKWLSEIGTEDEQKRYLQKKVLLQIFERFEFQKHDNFVGYILTSKNLIT